jgi:NAD+ kinase
MNAIVVFKKSKLDDLTERSPERLEQLRANDAIAWQELVDSSQQQHDSNERVVEALERCGIRSTLLARDAFHGPEAETDLVIAVGGDGTVLDVSHRVEEVPVLGINSDPNRSVGYFCATDAAGLPDVLERWQRGRLGMYTLHRMRICVDGLDYPYPCMNDLLVANQNPGMMSRYVISAGQRSEKQSSSGVWISTPAGSTAGIRSAGGTVMPLEGALCQYLVREPFLGRTMRFDLLRGVRHLREGLRLTSLMDGGRIYIDGPYLTLPFPLGSVLSIHEGPLLRMVGMHPELRER